MPIIAVTGGIGAGKSVVCRILSAMGYHVYDCDSRAKVLMDQSNSIKIAIAEHISPCAIDEDGGINRQALSDIVFSDPSKLATLNGIVHAAVRQDIALWKSSLPPSATAFVETAIIRTGGIDAMADAAWIVQAPLQMRLCRVMRRNSLSRQSVLSRISAQEKELENLACPAFEIINDGKASLLSQIHSLLG